MTNKENFVFFLNRENLNSSVREAGFRFLAMSNYAVAIVDAAGDFKGFFDGSVGKGFMTAGDGVAAGFAAHELETNEHGYREILRDVFSLNGNGAEKDDVFIELSSEPIH